MALSRLSSRILGKDAGRVTKEPAYLSRQLRRKLCTQQRRGKKNWIYSGGKQLASEFGGHEDHHEHESSTLRGDETNGGTGHVSVQGK
ncbi:hypothetical protein Slin15195_G129410 [Septoria linicola]|uniref:Uncharacterized protein n=1 Tax=Septoria linicola TaxID=215465 RepID=A0A9Q9B984_9PEZI|nr:hypothetical protein Slin15195_G129410 [Septoria linicola]